MGACATTAGPAELRCASGEGRLGKIGSDDWVLRGAPSRGRKRVANVMPYQRVEVLSAVPTVTTTRFLAEFAKTLRADEHAVMVLDCAAC